MARSRSRSSLGLSVEGSLASPTSASYRARSPGFTNPILVITTPPWARDETPSPPDERPDPLNFDHEAHGTDSNASTPGPSGSHNVTWDATSSNDSYRPEEPGSRWWTFARPRRRASDGTPDEKNEEQNAIPLSDNLNPSDERQSPMKERSRSSSWFVDPTDYWWRHRQRRQNTASTSHDTVRPSTTITIAEDSAEKGAESEPDMASNATPKPANTSLHNTPPSGRNTAGLHLDLPPPERAFTMTHNSTPGWDSPWVPHQRSRPSPNGRLSGVGEEEGGPSEYRDSSDDDDDNTHRRTKWGSRKKRFRQFCLHHNYVPLIFRLLNLAATTSTLGVAIRERRLELTHHVLGAIGSSITLVIIFAPLTMVHVLLAIYLEYFGRPLGLWRTSLKLLYTLLETVFICIWSAALSLCMDNYFTSELRCAPESATHWWNALPKPPNPLGQNFENSLSDNLCEHQIALIVLVFFGVITYCSSLFISLFRIFEKVKYRTIATNHA